MPFAYRLELEDGTPADPPTLKTAVPNRAASDTIPLGPCRMLRVVRLRDDAADQPPVLVVEEWPEERLAPSADAS
jgi:hypothetical protein